MTAAATPDRYRSQLLATFSDQLRDLHGRDRLRQLIPRQVDGIRLIDPDGREWINFGSNDYLGIAADCTTSGGLTTGSAASPLVSGWTARHERLARCLADFEQTESAVLFPTGYSACSGTVATLAQRGDLILSDELNHASLIDGCRLSRADRTIYPHRDAGSVAAILREKRSDYRHAWIVTDGVFGMDGRIAPLAQLCEIADQFRASLIVDEAHGTGVLGDCGRGACEAVGAENRVLIRIGTLSKALGSQGGFVAGPRVICDFLVNRCRTLIYSTAAAPATMDAAISALETIQSDGQRRTRLRQRIGQLRAALSLHSTTEVESHVPLLVIPVGADDRAIELSTRIAERGFFVPAIRPPTVPEGTARLRISLSAAHSEQAIARLAIAVRDLMEEAKIQPESVKLSPPVPG